MQIQVTVTFHSYFRDLTGAAQAVETLPGGATLGELYGRLKVRFSGLQDTEKCTLLAVGVEYQDHGYVLRDGDEVSLFPPVQGG